MKIITILGTRPEIIKMSPILPLLNQDFKHILIHTGQHYDFNMDKIFFEELNLKKPDYMLNIGSHSHAKQTAMMLEKIEDILIKENPSLIIVHGDTNSTLAGGLAAAKLQIPIIHIESGCRSFNKTVPEETNRIIVDHISNTLIAPNIKEENNLLKEGINSKMIKCLGSTSFDAIKRNKELIPLTKILKKFELIENNFVLVTLHRAGNTNNLDNLRNIINAINTLSEKIKFIFPIHPRTKKIIEENKIKLNKNILIIKPQSYLTFLGLIMSSRFIISDSGGIQEEALALNTPCLIPRSETEWDWIVKAGKNFLVGADTKKIIELGSKLIESNEELEKIKSIRCDVDRDVSKKIIEVIKSYDS